jgi:signal transduction histidine kinase
MSRTRQARPISVALAVAGGVAVFALIVFAETMTTSRVAGNAADLHWTNATMGSGATARAAAVQANLFLAAAEFDLSDQAVVDAAVEEVQRHRDSFAGWVAAGDVSDSTALGVALIRFGETLDSTIAALETGNPATASAHIEGPLGEAWRDAEFELERAQQAAVERVSSSDGLASIIGLALRVAITLIVPVTAVVIYRLQARRQVQEARQRFEYEMSTQQRLASARNELIAGVSHELRTPLTAIVGFSDVLAAAGHDSDVTDMAGIIHGEARSLRRMVDDFLAATRVSDGTVETAREECDLTSLVDTELADFRKTHRIGTRLEPATATTDRLLVAHILRNLVWNAVTHGGPAIWVSGEIRDGAYHLAVSDDGPGLEPDVAAAAFEPFANDGSAVTAGSVGLGLFVARGLALAVGGDIRYARVDGWTHFVVVVPDAAEVIEEEAAAA